MRLSPEESQAGIRVDVISPLRALVVPAAELIAITGLVWILLGYIDAGNLPVSTDVRNWIVALWAAFAGLRFAFSIIRIRRRRIILTNARLLVRSPGLRGVLTEIPLHTIREMYRHRGTISLSIHGHDRLLVLTKVPKAKKVHAALSKEISRYY